MKWGNPCSWGGGARDGLGVGWQTVSIISQDPGILSDLDVVGGGWLGPEYNGHAYCMKYEWWCIELWRLDTWRTREAPEMSWTSVSGTQGLMERARPSAWPSPGWWTCFWMTSSSSSSLSLSPASEWHHGQQRALSGVVVVPLWRGVTGGPELLNKIKCWV